MFGMYQMNDELEVVSEMREDELWWFTICVSRLKFANCEFSVQYLRSPSHTSPSQSPDCPPKVKSSFIFPSTAACRSQYRLFEEYVIPQRQEQIEFCLSYIPLFVFIFSPSSIYLPRGFWRESVRSVGLMQQEGQRVFWSQQGSWVTCLPSAHLCCWPGMLHTLRRLILNSIPGFRSQQRGAHVCGPHTPSPWGQHTPHWPLSHRLIIVNQCMRIWMFGQTDG